MRILAFSHTGLVSGGAEQCLLEYVDALVARGHECKVIIPHEGPMQKAFTDKGIDNMIIGYGWAIRPYKQFDLHKLLTSNGNSLTKIFNEVQGYKPDVILVNTSVIPWGLYAGHIFQIPSVLLIHEILNEKDPSLDVLPDYTSYATSVLSEYADTVVYNSNFVKREFENEISKPFTSKKILYPLPPLDKEKIDNLYQQNKIDKVLKIAIFGALAPRKNQLEAIEAAGELKRMGTTSFSIDLYGDIAANVPYVRKLRKAIKTHSLEDHVKLKGYTNTVYKTMNEYNVILSTSTHEPFGRTIIEGQLFGRIVIANDTGGGPELINDNETGYLYELGNAKELAGKISYIIENQKKAFVTAQKARDIQTKTFLTNHRYDALIESVEFYADKAANDSQSKDDFFNPIRALYEYNIQLQVRYEKFEKILYNKYTRSAKRIFSRAKNIAKRTVKEILSK